MTDHLTEAEIMAAIPGLTHSRLMDFVEAEVVIPLGWDGVCHTFHHADRHRLQFLCELAEDLDLNDMAVGVIIALIDQLHVARADTVALARAIHAQPVEDRARIGTALLLSRPP